MIDDQGTTVPAGKQDAPMPSADQVPTTPAPAQEVAPQETPSSDQGESSLPEDASERTRQNFEKMREKASAFEQELKAERQRREYLEGVFNSINQPKQEAQPPIYDPETGLLNEKVLTDVQRRTTEAENRANRAEAAVQGYLKQQEETEAFTAHPELKPDSKQFDKTLHNLTRSILTDSMLNPQEYGGKQLSFKEAADFAKNVSKPVIEQARQDGAKQALEQLTPKEQAALEATGTPARRSEVNSSLPDLQRGTRKGDVNSVIERLKGVPWK